MGQQGSYPVTPRHSPRESPAPSSPRDRAVDPSIVFVGMLQKTVTKQALSNLFNHYGKVSLSV
jgi:RNA recognition motif-containing protein